MFLENNKAGGMVLECCTDAIDRSLKWSSEYSVDENWDVRCIHLTDCTHVEYFFSSIDTGIDYTHPALGGRIGPGNKVIGGFDFVGDNYNGL